MSLYISNPSKQNVTFFYRDPINNLLARMDIGSGRQVMVGAKWTAAEKARVIEQLERFGSRDAAEAHGKMGRFLGLLYRDMAPISTDEILMGHTAMVDTQEQRTVAETTKAALAFDRVTNGAIRGQRRARQTQVEVIEQLAPHSRPTGNEASFSLTVDPEGRGDIPLTI
jgi:hypothetical protein